MARTSEGKTTKKPAGKKAEPDLRASTGPVPDAPAADLRASTGPVPGAPAADLRASTGPVPATSGAAAPAARTHHRQVKVGRVVSNKMDKTVIVTVENTITHRLYHRYMKRTSKFAAHDAENRCQIGDVVEIVSSRPISRTKRWRVREVLKRAE